MTDTTTTVDPSSLGVFVPPEPPDAPPPELRVRRPLKVRDSLGELWRSRELVRALAERQLRAQYKQAMLGFVWALLGPLLFMVVFTVFFQRVANVNTGGVPYPLFAYLGLVPWTFFSSSVSTGGLSLVHNASLLNKLYCPRAVFPLAMIACAGVDTLIAVGALVALFGVLTFAPHATATWLPVLLLVQVAFTVGVTLTVSAITVYFRDVRHALPMVLQLLLFATPVAYGFEIVPPSLRGVYAAINPLGPVIDGYRRTILYGRQPDWHLLGIGAVTAFVVLVLGYTVFRRLEAGFSDVA
jgi:ABC-type polysaccharide/polyol phosphate export permease